MVEVNKKPTCVGFIMDGNRRWAEAHRLSSFDGHRRGYDVLRVMIDVAHKNNIPHLVCYAFSTENWKREENEVTYLMELLAFALNDLYQTITEDGKKICLRVIGEKERLPNSLQKEIVRIESLEFDQPEITVWLALSYGGRAEIIQAVNRAITEGTFVTEASFAQFLWTQKMPDPDLIIRTSGEIRLSNFLLWQSAYSELFFTKTPWPDFGETEFQSMLDEYAKRSRRIGA